MELITTPAALRARLRTVRGAFVPTMGNLHAGHLALIEQAAALARPVIVSIFVNPLQFNSAEDFAHYPRTLESDLALLKNTAADFVFAPEIAAMYPDGGLSTVVHVQGLSELLCGALRPGHFDGVATVVARLFNLVQPSHAVFGEKDYQQLLIVRRMVRDLAMPVEIIPAPTLREPDGLALSSRNGYLTAAERACAPRLYAVLCELGTALKNGARSFDRIESAAMDALAKAGCRPEYVAIRRPADLTEPAIDDDEFQVLAAAWLGRARLLDNLRVSATLDHDRASTANS